MSFDRKKTAHKVVWPKFYLTVSACDRKLFLKMIIWPKVHLTKSFFQKMVIWFDRLFFFDKLLFSKNCHLTDCSYSIRIVHVPNFFVTAKRQWKKKNCSMILMIVLGLFYDCSVDSNGESRLFYLLSKTIFRKKHSVKWPILEKKHSIKWTFGQKTFRSNDHFAKKAFGHIKFRSNDLSVNDLKVIWTFGQMNFRSNDLSVKCSFFEKALGQMNFRSSVIWLVFQVRSSVKWPFSKYFRSNDFLKNYIFGQMTFLGKMNFRSNGLRLNGDSV
jgi:hypothetical protein